MRAFRSILSVSYTHLLLHHDWTAFKAAEARTLPLYPAFEEQSDGTLRAVIHYKDYDCLLYTSQHGLVDPIFGVDVLRERRNLLGDQLHEVGVEVKER